jgi:hypothetical protein
VTDALLYVTVEIIMSEGRCHEILLYVPYWIVNLTGLKLEYEFDEERTGHEHSTMYVSASLLCVIAVIVYLTSVWWLRYTGC